jgi:hypothetical protein
VKWHCNLTAGVRLGAAIGGPGLWTLHRGQEPEQVIRHFGRRIRAGPQVSSRKQRRRQHADDG